MENAENDGRAFKCQEVQGQPRGWDRLSDQSTLGRPGRVLGSSSSPPAEKLLKCHTHPPLSLLRFLLTRFRGRSNGNPGRAPAGGAAASLCATRDRPATGPRQHVSAHPATDTPGRPAAHRAAVLGNHGNHSTHRARPSHQIPQLTML